VTPIDEGYARARILTRAHSKSFYFASLGLFGARRRSAFALYAFCRRLDDLVDGDNDGRGTVRAPAGDVRAQLEQCRQVVAAIYGRAPMPAVLPWNAAELAAFRDTVERARIPELPFQELINGMEMDLAKTRYATFDELALYCHRVAGVVGLMMTPVLGYSDERCLPYAADLGVAMQLTNILRDVKEDLARGRVYLPADELARFGVTEAALAAGTVDERWVAFMKFQLERARGVYERAQLGVPGLSGFGSQRVARLMGLTYGGILNVIEARGYDVFRSRARVGLVGKLALGVQVLLTPNPPMPSLPATTSERTS
jgi:phytoene synthase